MFGSDRTVGDTRYTWKDVQSGSVLATGPSATSLTVQRPNPGTYDFELLVVDNEGETDTASVSLQVGSCLVAHCRGLTHTGAGVLSAALRSWCAV